MDILFALEWIFGQFAEKLLEAQKEYRRLVLAGIKAVAPREKHKARCILGSKEFIEKIKPAIRGVSS